MMDRTKEAEEAEQMRTQAVVAGNPVVAAGPHQLLPCCWGCRVEAGPSWDFGDQDGEGTGTTMRPSRAVITEWVKEWADGGNHSGWSPYKSCVVNWVGHKRGDNYYYKLADINNMHDVQPTQEQPAYQCKGQDFWKIANLWDGLLADKVRSMHIEIDAVLLTFAQRRVLREALIKEYCAALRDKTHFYKVLHSCRHVMAPACSTLNPTAAKKPAMSHIVKKPAGTTSIVCKKPAKGR